MFDSLVLLEVEFGVRRGCLASQFLVFCLAVDTQRGLLVFCFVRLFWLSVWPLEKEMGMGARLGITKTLGNDTLVVLCVLEIKGLVSGMFFFRRGRLEWMEWDGMTS